MNRPRNEAEERAFARRWDAMAEVTRQDHNLLVAEIVDPADTVADWSQAHARAIADRPAIADFAEAWDFEAMLLRLSPGEAGS